MNMLPRFCVDLRKVEKEHKLNSNHQIIENAQHYKEKVQKFK
jgi:hypothetical protein